jgi:hypothetical protein
MANLCNGAPCATGRLAGTGATGATWATGATGAMGEIGAAGAPGQKSLMAVSSEPAVSNCATGGIGVETGVDVNDNGVLEPLEVNAAQTQHNCNGLVSVAN